MQIYLTFRRHGAVDAALHHGKSGWLMITGETLSGPLPLIFAGLKLWPAAGIAFLLGSLISRFGWLAAGRASACDPKSVLESETGAQTSAETRIPYVLDPAIASFGQHQENLEAALHAIAECADQRLLRCFYDVCR